MTKHHNTTHGMVGTRFYSSWLALKNRCKNKSQGYIARYRTKITYPYSWENFEGFRDDMYQSFLTHAKEHGEGDTTIDRIDSTKGYSKENCRWATYKVQSRNVRTNHIVTYGGKSQCLSDWADELGVNRGTLFARINKHKWTIREAFTRPVIKRT